MIDEAEFRRLFRDLMTSPRLFPQKLDLENSRILLMVMDEQRYRSASFLDDRMLTDKPQAFWVPVAALVRQYQSAIAQCPPLHFLFHVGHCGSTLLSRLLGDLPGLHVLREPAVFRTLAAARRIRFGAGGPEQHSKVPHWPLFLDLFSRSWQPRQATLLKATSDCNNLVLPVLANDPRSRLLLLYLDLETYLVAMLRTSAIRDDLVTFAPTRLADFRTHGGCEDFALDSPTAGQLAVLQWLAIMGSFQAARGEDEKRTRYLNFDAFLEQPQQSLTELAAHLQVETSEAQIAGVLASSVATSHAKAPGYQYDAQARRHDLAEARSRYADEIREAMTFAASLVRRYDSLTPLAEMAGI